MHFIKLFVYQFSDFWNQKIYFISEFDKRELLIIDNKYLKSFEFW